MKMKVNLLSILLALVTFVALYAGIKSLFAANPGYAPRASQGYLDLSGYTLTGRDAIRLDGEWAFVPGRLVGPDYFQSGGSFSYVNVPSIWTAYKVNGASVPGYTSATYRLQVKLNDRDRDAAIKITNIRMSSKLYINGQPVRQSGEPQENRSYTPRNVPYAKIFHSDSPIVDILIQAANFDYATGGGIVSSIYLGDEISIHKLGESATAYDWIVIALFLTMGIYSLGYYLQIGREPQLLMFFFFCCCVSLFQITHGERLLPSMLPALPYGIFERLQGLSGLGVGLFLSQFYTYSLKDVRSAVVSRVFPLVGVALMLTLLLPVRLNSYLEAVHSGYLACAFAYVAYLSFAAALRRTGGAVYLILSSLAMMALFIVESLDNLGNQADYINLHILPFIYLVTIALYMSHHFTKDYLRKEKLNAQLLQHDRLKDEFLAKTSHEFRTPLHGVIAIVESMLGTQQRQTLTKEQTEKLSLVANVSRRLSGLVNDILNHAKLKHGEFAIHPKPFELYSAVQSVVAFFGHLAQKNVRILNRIPPGSYYVLGDEERVRQILYNLIGNALQYTEEGQIEIRYAAEDHYAYISVSDTGAGISQEQAEAIFEPYRQVNATNSGVGLGLSIVKQLVELQGGQVTVQSAVGQGSVFTFSLPLASPATAETETAGSNMPDTFAHGEAYRLTMPTPLIIDGPNRPKLLLADDDPLNLKVLIDILEPEGYSIVAVNSGAQALEQLEAGHGFSLALLDIMMPGMSGFEVCQTLRRSFSLVELPVLMLTAAILPEDIAAAFQSGANDFLYKPLDAFELKTRVRNLISVKETAEKATRMELSFLQAQIKPHFIYNVLNSILSLSYSDVEQARALLMSFSHFLRGSFIFATIHNRVPLHQEISLVQSYVEIEKARYPGLFEFELIWEAKRECHLPPMMIQPLVENAIRHGMKKTKQGGLVQVRIASHDDQLHVQISDNGTGISPEKINELHHPEGSVHGVGLANIIQRIRQLPRASLDISSEPGQGTVISLHIPQLLLT